MFRMATFSFQTAIFEYALVLDAPYAELQIQCASVWVPICRSGILLFRTDEKLPPRG